MSTAPDALERRATDSWPRSERPHSRFELSSRQIGCSLRTFRLEYAESQILSADYRDRVQPGAGRAIRRGGRRSSRPRGDGPRRVSALRDRAVRAGGPGAGRSTSRRRRKRGPRASHSAADFSDMKRVSQVYRNLPGRLVAQLDRRQIPVVAALGVCRRGRTAWPAR